MYTSVSRQLNPSEARSRISKKLRSTALRWLPNVERESAVVTCLLEVSSPPNLPAFRGDLLIILLSFAMRV